MRIEDLGKRATFLIPSVKVYNSKYDVLQANFLGRGRGVAIIFKKNWMHFV